MNDQNTTQAEKVLHLTVDTFDQALTDAGDKPVLVDFFATWCGPCQMAAPVIDKLGQDYDGKAVIAKVDVDDNGDLASRYGVRSIPTVVLIHNGEVVDKQVGFNGEAGYVSMLKKVLGD